MYAIATDCVIKIEYKISAIFYEKYTPVSVKPNVQ